MVERGEPKSGRKMEDMKKDSQEKEQEGGQDKWKMKISRKEEKKKGGYANRKPAKQTEREDR